MLKSLLSSGWFRVQSSLNCSAIILLVAPLLVVSGSSSARQSQVEQNTSAEGLPDSAIDASAEEVAFDSVTGGRVAGDLHSATSSLAAKKGHLQGVELSTPMAIAAVRQTSSIQADAIDSLVDKQDSANNILPQKDPLAAVELSPAFAVPSSHSVKQESQLLQKLRNYKTASAKPSVAAAPSTGKLPKAQQMRVVDELSEAQLENQEDPIASPHPVPWKWIVATQEAIGSQGTSGVRYYRSMPVMSPDGRYAVYSRVQLRVEPEMHNTRVTSVLFIEDRQTKALKVLKSTSHIREPLLQAQATPANYVPHGTIEIFVPVSWSQNGDRFLARKFQGIMNTSDAKDSALIWDRENNSTNTITPSEKEDEHHKIAVLLGWSKTQPTQVMFRAGELGDEEWPLVTVANNGATVAATDADQPVVFGDRNQDIWGESQVAYR
jgi:hypothetical protein